MYRSCESRGSWCRKNHSYCICCGNYVHGYADHSADVSLLLVTASRAAHIVYAGNDEPALRRHSRPAVAAAAEAAPANPNAASDNALAFNTAHVFLSLAQCSHFRSQKPYARQMALRIAPLAIVTCAPSDTRSKSTVTDDLFPPVFELCSHWQNGMGEHHRKA